MTAEERVGYGRVRTRFYPQCQGSRLTIARLKSHQCILCKQLSYLCINMVFELLIQRRNGLTSLCGFDWGTRFKFELP